MVITDPVLKDSLKLTELRPIKINGFGEGDDIEAYYSKSPSVKIGFAEMNFTPTVILKEDLFNLSGYVGKPIYGLIGYNFFNSFVVKINYISKRMVFSSPDIKKRIKGEKIDLEFIENKPYINAKIETPELGIINTKLIVDCGASHALSLEKFNENAFPIPNPNISGNLGVGLSGAINGNISRINKLNIGSFSFDNVLTNFPKFSEIALKTNQKLRNGNLGSDILKRFNITFDYQNSVMYLKKNENFKSPFEHDMSGIEIYAEDKPYLRFFISRVEEDSPAAKAGFLKDDEIKSINFKNIDTYSLNDISAMFKADDGKTVIIEVWRKDQTIIKLLRLKRRI
jgi:hypothetical protein